MHKTSNQRRNICQKQAYEGNLSIICVHSMNSTNTVCLEFEQNALTSSRLLLNRLITDTSGLQQNIHLWSQFSCHIELLSHKTPCFIIFRFFPYFSKNLPFKYILVHMSSLLDIFRYNSKYSNRGQVCKRQLTDEQSTSQLIICFHKNFTCLA